MAALGGAGLLSVALRSRWENRLLELRRRGGRQGVVAEVGHRALAGADLTQLADWAASTERSLIANAAAEPRDGAIINAITSLASSFLIEVIGEGVETADHVEALRTYGCLLGQGFHLAAPAAPDSFVGEAAGLIE